MRAIDTNILLRYLTRDDPQQAAAAKRFIDKYTAKERIFINLVTLSETVWALKKIYGYDKSLLVDVIRKILDTEQFEVEHFEVAWEALALYLVHSVEFADALIGVINKQAGYPKTATFDKKAAALAEFELLS